MIRVVKIALASAMLLIWGYSCKEKYVPETNYPFTGYLVVEGVIEPGGGTTSFRLSRTTALDSSYYRDETGATVSVESENNESYPLTESASGRYQANGLPVQPGLRYRLHIITAGAREYLSQLTAVYATPPIDSVNWTEKNNGVQIYVSTHNSSIDTGYYKWRFDETWRYTAKYYSAYIWDPASPSSFHDFRNRNDNELVNTCYKSDTSSDILIGSTAKLAANVLNGQPVTFIPYSEIPNKLYNRYTIQVYMESISADEFAWYDKLRKNTESLGSIFDAQPSELTGNIQSLTDPTETVIGWVGSHTVTQKRIFIGRGDLPSKPALSKGYDNCMLDTLLFGLDDQQIENAYSSGIYNLPTGFDSPPGSAAPVGIIGSSIDCTDCRTMGGVITEPDFWHE